MSLTNIAVVYDLEWLTTNEDASTTVGLCIAVTKNSNRWKVHNTITNNIHCMNKSILVSDILLRNDDEDNPICSAMANIINTAWIANIVPRLKEINAIRPKPFDDNFKK